MKDYPFLLLLTLNLIEMRNKDEFIEKIVIQNGCFGGDFGCKSGDIS